MPSAIDNLSPDSSCDAVREAVSASIAMYIREGRDQDQAIAIAYSKARKKGFGRCLPSKVRIKR